MNRRFSMLLALVLCAACILPSCRPDDDDDDAGKPIELTPAIAVPHPDPTADAAINPAIAYDGTRVHMVYAQNNGAGLHNLMYTNRIGAGPWSAPAPLFPASTADSRNPHVHLHTDGTLHVVWEEGTSPNRDIYYVTRTSAGSVNIAVNLTSSGTDEANPRVHVDADNRVHAVWEGVSAGPPVTSTIFYARTQGSLFLSPVALDKANGNQPAEMPDITTDDGKRVYVIWSEQNGPARNLRLIRSDSHGAVWGQVGNGFAVSGSVDMTHGRIRGGVDGEVFLCFVGQDLQGERALHATFTRDGGNFATPGQLATSETGGIRDPEMATWRRPDNNFTIAIVYNDGNAGGGNIMVKTSRNNGATYPGNPINLSQGNSQATGNRHPSVAMDDNEIVVAWDGQPQGGGVVRTWCSLNNYQLP